jgi:hypothetical protein
MDLSQTDELLLYCLRVVPDNAGESRLQELSSSDWDVLIENSCWDGITPLLYYRLKTFHPGAQIPAEVFQKLRNSYLHSAGRNMRLYHELGKVLGMLRQHGIPVIALKGAHLAIAVYRNISLRPMGDVDLLVKQIDLLKVQDILVEQSYIPSKEEIFCAQEHLPSYRKKDSIVIEIHFNIVAPPFSDRVDVEKLFARAQTFFIEGIEVLSLCPEDLLLQLCMHASFKHTFDNGIRPLFDISTAIEHYEGNLDWEQFLGRGKEWGVSKCIYLALFLAKRFAGASISGQIMKDLDVYNDSFHATARAEELIFRKGASISPNIVKLFNNDTLLNKLIHAIRCAFPPKSTLANMRPPARNPLSVYFLYFFRIKGLLQRHRQAVWRLFLRDREMSTMAIFANKKTTLKDWLTQRN